MALRGAGAEVQRGWVSGLPFPFPPVSQGWVREALGSPTVSVPGWKRLRPVTSETAKVEGMLPVSVF